MYAMRWAAVRRTHIVYISHICRTPYARVYAKSGALDVIRYRTRSSNPKNLYIPIPPQIETCFPNNPFVYLSTNTERIF